MALDESEQSPLMRLYMEKRRDLVRFFTLRTSSASDAEDIVQEIWIRLHGIGDVENPAAFLYRTGTNLMLDRARSSRRSRARDDSYHMVNQVRGAGANEDETGEPSPEQTLEGRQRVARLMQLIKAMPEQRQRVFVMHKLKGLSYGEVAESLGISRSAVEKHMMAALRQIAELRE